MISDRAIDLAVAQAVITTEQAERLRATERELAKSAPEPVDEEKLRFVTGFADIFVSMGIVLFLGALAFLMNNGAGSTPMFAGIAACAWLLAEFFTGKRRMALPSIVLLVIFVGAVALGSLQVAMAIFHTGGDNAMPLSPPQAKDALPFAVAAIVATAMAAMHYLRFRVPITIAAGVASLCVLVVALATVLVPSVTETMLNWVVLFCGVAAFALAMRFDMSDPLRQTRRTDIAFWLHLLAAPLIVHPLIRGLIGGPDSNLSLGMGAAVGILWVFLFLGIVAVIVDRRAILVSGLAYAGLAFGSLILAAGVADPNLVVPTVLLLLGAFILVLSAGWQPLRRAILRRLPDPLSGRLPNPLVQSNT